MTGDALDVWECARAVCTCAEPLPEGRSVSPCPVHGAL